MKLYERIVGSLMNGMAVLAPKLTAKMAFKIFCYPFKPSLKDYQKSFLKSSLFDQFEVGDEKIALYRWGTGPKKLLFLHGWASHSFRWKEYVKDFDPDRYSIFAIDAPAHGLSDGNQSNIPKYAKAINQAVKMIDGADVAIGHSFGGLSLLASVYEYPKMKIDKLVIMGAPGEAISFMQYYRDKIGLSERTTTLINNKVKEIFGHGLEYYSNKKFGKAIKNEMLIIHDKLDNEVPFENAQALHAVANNSKLILTEGLGHRQKGKEMVNLIYNFVDHGINVEELVSN